MTLLSDRELVSKITQDPRIIIGLPKERLDWYDKDSPIQPSSIDLHIGEIFVPGKKDSSFFFWEKKCKPKTEYILMPGHTTVVCTKEEINFPNDLAGIGFPLSRNSSQGILMTNPGHIDPGYQGPLRFTLINMSRKKFPLRAGDKIVTLILIKMHREAEKGWFERNEEKSKKPDKEQVNRLAPDFGDIENRAIKISKKEINKAHLKSLWVPVIAAVIAGVITLISTYLTVFKQPIKDLETAKSDIKAITANLQEVENVKTDIADLKAKLDIEKLRKEIEDLRKVLNKQSLKQQ